MPALAEVVAGVDISEEVETDVVVETDADAAVATDTDEAVEADVADVVDVEGFETESRPVFHAAHRSSLSSLHAQLVALLIQPTSAAVSCQ